MLAGVDERDPPVVADDLVRLDGSLAEVDRHVGRELAAGRLERVEHVVNKIKQLTDQIFYRNFFFDNFFNLERNFTWLELQDKADNPSTLDSPRKLFSGFKSMTIDEAEVTKSTDIGCLTKENQSNLPSCEDPKR